MLTNNIKFAASLIIILTPLWESIIWSKIRIVFDIMSELKDKDQKLFWSIFIFIFIGKSKNNSHKHDSIR